MNWLLNRLREPSTWRGLVWLLTALGVSLSPEAWQYITTAGMALAGLVGVLSSEKAQRVQILLPPIELVGQPGADRADPVCGVAAERLPDPAMPSGPDAEASSGFNDR